MKSDGFLKLTNHVRYFLNQAKNKAECLISHCSSAFRPKKKVPGTFSWGKVPGTRCWVPVFLVGCVDGLACVVGLDAEFAFVLGFEQLFWVFDVQSVDQNLVDVVYKDHFQFP